MAKAYTKNNLIISYTSLTGNFAYLPTQLADDSSIYILRAPKKEIINPGANRIIKTGICLNMPEIVETVNEGDTKSRYSKLTLQAHISSSPYLAEAKGLIVLTPQLLPSAHTSEIVIILHNLNKGVMTLNAGDEMALLSFSMVPRIQLNYTVNE